MGWGVALQQTNKKAIIQSNSSMNDAIQLLSENKDPIDIQIDLGDDIFRVYKAEISILDECGDALLGFTHHFKDRDEWDQLGRAIGNCTVIEKLELRNDENGYYRVRGTSISSEAYECVEIFYRGLMQNSSIVELDTDIDLFPDDGTLPVLNINDAKFKDRLKQLSLRGSVDTPIGDNQSFMFSSVLETMSLERLNICKLPLGISSESALRRIILACTKVKSLEVRCDTLAKCAAIASLLENPACLLESLNLVNGISEDELSIIAGSLTRNTTLKKMYIFYFGEYLTSIEKLLCDTTSIRHIYNSNHTLKEIIDKNIKFQGVIDDCLELNWEENKEKVIRTKIARYYFIGNFDLSPFVDMNVSLLPSVLAMIEGNMNTRQSAVFRLLRTIPDLCNVSSRKDTDQFCNKRQRFD